MVKRRLGDVVPVLVMMAWTQADVWAPSLTQPNHFIGPQPVMSATYAVASLALLSRRRWPLLTAIVSFAVLAVPMLVYGAPENLGEFLPPLLAMYAIGAHADARGALAGLAVAGAWSVLFLVRDPFLQTSADYVRAAFYDALMVLPWAFGILVRNPRLRAVEWERRATRLERERRQEVDAAIRDERVRIARELHDIVSHAVGLIVLQAQAGDTRVGTEPALAHDAFHSIETSAREAMVELRRMLGLLRDDGAGADLAPQPGLRQLPAVVEDLRAAGLEVDVDISGRQRTLSRGVETNAFRVIQEALTNSLRHADARCAKVAVVFTDDAVELEITDDGRAVPGRIRPGHGLVGMQERVHLYGGQLTFSAQKPSGFRVWARLPITEGEA